MPNVQALTSFEHGGKRKRNEVFFASEAQAIALSRAGLVIIQNDVVPTKAVSKEVELSVLEAAQVLPEQTLNQSENGDTPKKRGRKPKQSLL